MCRIQRSIRQATSSGPRDQQRQTESCPSCQNGRVVSTCPPFSIHPTKILLDPQRTRNRIRRQGCDGGGSAGQSPESCGGSERSTTRASTSEDPISQNRRGESFSACHEFMPRCYQGEAEPPSCLLAASALGLASHTPSASGLRLHQSYTTVVRVWLQTPRSAFLGSSVVVVVVVVVS